MQTVYLDVLFLFNALVDYIILTLTLKIANIDRKLRYIVLAAFVGGIGSCLIFVIKIPLILQITTILLSGFIAFGKKKGVTYIKLYGLLLCISIAFGGGFYALSALGIGVVTSNGVGYMNISFMRFILIFMALYFPIKLSYSIYNKRKHKALEKAVISFNGDQYQVNVLVDTGSTLCEPATKTPVLLLSEGVIDKIYEKPYLIPYNSIGSAGLLKGSKASACVGDKKFENIIIVDTGQKLSKSGDFEGIISWQAMLSV